MKKILILFILIIMTVVVSGYSSSSWTTNDYNNQNNAQPTGASLINSWSNFTILNCLIQTQPIVYDMDEDGDNEIILYCNNTGKTKIYTDAGVLIDEVSIGVLQNNLAFVTDATYRFSGVFQNGGDVNLTYVGLDENNSLYVDYTINNSAFGGGDSVICPLAEDTCYATDETTIIVDLFNDGTNHYCKFINDTSWGYVLCYDDGYMNNTLILNTTTVKNTFGSLFMKLHAGNFDGGDSEIYAVIGSNDHLYTYSIDSTGIILWTEDNQNLHAGGATNPHRSSFIYGFQICTLNQHTYTNQFTKLSCREFSGTETITNQWGVAQNALTDNRVLVTSFDYNNDATKEILLQGQIYDIDTLNKFPLNVNNTQGGFYSIAIDINRDGSLDYTDSDGNNIYFFINGYSNAAPTITQVDFNTGNPVCLYSSVEYSVYFTDTEDDWGKVRIDRYGDGNYTGYGNIAGTPTQTATYNKLGTFTTVIELTDESDNVINTTHGVIVQTSNCYSSGQGGDSDTAATDSTTIVLDFGGFIMETGNIDGYKPNNDPYNENNSIYFNSQRCIDTYGTNWKQMFIPCPFRLFVSDTIDQLETWIIGSFIGVVIILIIFFLIMIVRHNRKT